MSTMEQGIVARRPATNGALGTLPRALTWPIVGLLLTGSWHFVIEAVWPGLSTIFVPAVISPLLLGYGAWAGFRAAAGAAPMAGFVAAIVAGLILGLLPLMLESVGFGVILGYGFDVRLLTGIYGLSMVLFGALLGGGFAITREH